MNQQTDRTTAPTAPELLRAVLAAVGREDMTVGDLPLLSGAGSAEPKRRRGRAKGGVGEFPATEFISREMKRAGKAGVRAGYIVEAVRAAAPGKHVSPSALVHTILRRLAAAGKVVRRGGRWVRK